METNNFSKLVTDIIKFKKEEFNELIKNNDWKEFKNKIYEYSKCYNIIIIKEIDTDILNFIQTFKSYEKNDVITDTFLNGFCYYFALILKHRYTDGEIYYDDSKNHFMFKLNDKFYDITGDCTDKYKKDNVISWNDYQKNEPSNSRVIIRDCINKNETVYI